MNLEHNSTQILGEVVAIVFHNQENDYIVARIRTKEEPAQVTIVGYLPYITPGEQIKVIGKWKEHPKFGRQFEVESYNQELPATLNGIRRYLRSGMIKGVGPALAERLLSRFGSKILDILDNQPSKLLEVEGIGSQKLKTIQKSWRGQKEIQSLILFLQTHQVPTTFAGKIFQRYGNEAIEKLKENPYDLIYEIQGIGFKTADKMAFQLGFSVDDPKRLEAVLIFGLFQFSEQGHLFYPREELLDKVLDIVQEGEREKLDQALEGLRKKKKVQIVALERQEIDQAVYLSHFYRWEKEITTRLFNLINHHHRLPVQDLEKILQDLEKESRISLSTEQRKAIFQACCQKVFIITGGPGTGKTTLTTFIVKASQSLGLKVKLAAPTGRAAKRLAEATGYRSSTIHRLLGYTPGGGLTYDEKKKLKADLILVDEVSMLDCQLFVNLLRAISLNCKLVLIGDVNQLPSVGPGNILADLLSSQRIPCLILSQIFRQAKESMIVVNSHRINQGLFPLASQKKAPEADFFWILQDDLEKIREQIVQMVCERIPLIYSFDPIGQIQVLSPMHKGILGTKEMNRVLRDKLNPKGDEIQSGSGYFRTGDKIIQTKNNYEKEVFNGDLGFIKSIDQDGGELIIDFDGKRKRYFQSELDQVDLAYTISVHKAQGSEYQAIILPLVTQHYIMLQRKLLYTALTRAKNLAILIGHKKALNIGIKSDDRIKRYTNLAYRVRDQFEIKDESLEKDF